jgi:PKD repeat protein
MRTSVISASIFMIFTFLTTLSYGQQNYASNVRLTYSDEQKLFVNYDIVVNDGTEYFYVFLDISYENNAIKPNSNNLFGDYGHAINPGNKIIFWNYSDEFKGDIKKVKVNIFAYAEKEPQAKFKSTPQNENYYAPCEINFTNLSENSNRYEWNFGDVNSGIENNSFEENPSHTFKNGGRYTITLKAYNTDINLENTFNETIVVKEYEPTVANFKIIGFENLKKQSVPLNVEFKNLSENADKYSWDFGDPNSGRNKNTSTEIDPSHRYKNPGQYQIELTAKSTFSGLSSKKTIEIVLPGKPSKIDSPTQISSSSEYDKHKKMKTIWLTSSITTFTTGGLVFLKSNSLHNDYNSSTTDAADIRKKYETLDKVYPALLGAAVLSGVMTIVHAKKQSEAKSKLSFQTHPTNGGGILTLTYNF